MASRMLALAAALLLLSGCGAEEAAPGVSSGPGTGTNSGPTSAPVRQAALRITTQLGEQCPHIPVTPDPNCDPKPRPDTGFEVTTATGDLVTRGRTGAGGQATVNVQPGTYIVRGENVEGWRIAPRRQVTVSGTGIVPVPLTYTNGIQ
jgi:hypothetical protein